MNKLSRAILLFVAVSWGICFGQNRELRGPYLGQESPGMTAEEFAPGLVSTELHEHIAPTFSLDGKEVFWSVWFEGKEALFTRKEIDGRWSERTLLTFDEVNRIDGAYFSPEGSRLYFYGIAAGSESTEDNWDVWYVDRQQSGWGVPVNIGAPINSEGFEIWPAVTRSGALYFGMVGEKRTFFRSELRAGVFGKPQKLPKMINTGLAYSHIFVEADERFIIFSSEREGGYGGGGDLYICHRSPSGDWGAAKNLGPGINSEKLDRFPQVTLDGKYLFFSRHEIRDGMTGWGDIFWVDAKAFIEH